MTLQKHKALDLHMRRCIPTLTHHLDLDGYLSTHTHKLIQLLGYEPTGQREEAHLGTNVLV